VTYQKAREIPNDNDIIVNNLEISLVSPDEVGSGGKTPPVL